jgi:very-short-patch-repair endonuclease
MIHATIGLMPAESRVCVPEVDKPSIPPDVSVARLAAEQWGVLSLRELRMCGMSRDAVKVRVRNGRLHPLYRGVYAVGHANITREGRFLAAVKACGPNAVLSHFSAAAHYDLVRWDGRFPEVTTRTERAHRGIRVHRSSKLEVQDITSHKGIPITTPARTLIDLAATFDYTALRRAVREAQRKLVTSRQILETLDRLGPRPGIANLTKILATGPAPTRSELEDAVLDLLIKGGFQHPDVNRPLTLDNRRIVPDFRWSQQRLVIEADGAEWHDNPLAREDDAERQAILEAHGERVIRVTWTQAITRRAQTLTRIREAGAPLAVRRIGDPLSAA